MNYYCYRKKKNELVGIGINVLNLRKEICDNNKFEILSKESGTEELSVDCIVEKFINTTNFIAKDLSIISTT
jgi:hypothetical protein